MFSDDNIVCDHTEVINFSALANARGTEGSAVNGGIGTDAHMIFYDHVAQLRNAVVFTCCIRGKSEAFRANDHTGFYIYMRTNFTAFQNFRTCTNKGMRTNFYIGLNYSGSTNNGRWINFRFRSNNSARALA